MAKQRSYPVLIPMDLIDRATKIWHAHGGSSTLGGRWRQPTDIMREAAHFGSLFIQAADIPFFSETRGLNAAWRVGFWLETEERIRRLGLPIARSFRAALAKGLSLYDGDRRAGRHLRVHDSG